MAKFNVYPLKKAQQTYVVDVQADVWSHFRTRMVVPLMLVTTPTKAAQMDRLQPIVTVNGRDYLFLASEMTVLATKELGETVGDVASFYDDIRDALDFLFQGF